MGAFQDLDRLLRGEETNGDTLSRSGLTGRIWPLARVCVMLAVGYGMCMGVYALFRPGGPEYRQVIAAAVKVPALFLLTLLVTFPSLYVFGTLLGARLGIGELLRLVVYALGVLLAVLAAFGPIVAFFSVTTTSYPFVVLLNVAVFAAAGAFGMSFLQRTLQRLAAVRAAPPAEPEGVVVLDQPGERRPAVARPVPRVSPVFYAWMVLFGVVGAQMGWVLRPFVGSPDVPFAWFRPREASFVEGVVRSLRSLFGG
jgi:hypothetical protein